jgi:uncharacterized protein YndB with AHSA1/START domain
MELRPRGIGEFIMHGPDGVGYPNKVAYLEVQKPKRLVYDHEEDWELSYVPVTVTVKDKATQNQALYADALQDSRATQSDSGEIWFR